MFDGVGSRGSRADVRAARRAGICYFLRVLAASDCINPFKLEAAALTFCFSFFGFFASRFPRCSPLAMFSPPARSGPDITLARTDASVTVFLVGIDAGNSELRWPIDQLAFAVLYIGTSGMLFAQSVDVPSAKGFRGVSMPILLSRQSGPSLSHPPITVGCRLVSCPFSKMRAVICIFANKLESWAIVGSARC